MRIETKHVRRWDRQAKASDIHAALGKMPPDGKVILDYSGLGGSNPKTTLIVIVAEGQEDSDEEPS